MARHPDLVGHNESCFSVIAFDDFLPFSPAQTMDWNVGSLSNGIGEAHVAYWFPVNEKQRSRDLLRLYEYAVFFKNKNVLTHDEIDEIEVLAATTAHYLSLCSKDRAEWRQRKWDHAPGHPVVFPRQLLEALNCVVNTCKSHASQFCERILESTLEREVRYFANLHAGRPLPNPPKGQLTATITCAYVLAVERGVGPFGLPEITELLFHQTYPEIDLVTLRAIEIILSYICTRSDRILSSSEIKLVVRVFSLVEASHLLKPSELDQYRQDMIRLSSKVGVTELHHVPMFQSIGERSSCELLLLAPWYPELATAKDMEEELGGERDCLLRSVRFSCLMLELQFVRNLRLGV